MHLHCFLRRNVARDESMAHLLITTLLLYVFIYASQAVNQAFVEEPSDITVIAGQSVSDSEHDFVLYR